MLKNKSQRQLLLTVAAWSFALTGCATKRQVVFVDTDRILASSSFSQQEAMILPSNVLEASQFSRSSVRFELENRQPEARPITSASIDRSSEKRLNTIEKLRSTRFDQLEKSLSLRQESAKNKLDIQKESLIRDAIERTREPFDRYVNQIGLRSLERANLAASLDALEQSSPEHPLKLAQNARITILDNEIKEFNSRYILERDTILNQSAMIISGREKGIQLEIANERAKQTQKILADLQELTRSSSPLERSFNAGANVFQLEGFSWRPKAVNLQTKKLELKFPTNSLPSKNAKLLISDIERWASLKGYDLGIKSGDCRDATSEFVSWRKSHRLGP